jgi:hypothetical protein
MEGLVFCRVVDDILHPYLHVINYAYTMVITMIHKLKIKGVASFFVLISAFHYVHQQNPPKPMISLKQIWHDFLAHQLLKTSR